MSRIIQAGAECQGREENWGYTDGQPQGAGCTIDTTVFRKAPGTASYKCDGASAGAKVYFVTATTSQDIWARAYIRFASFPDVTTTILQWSSAVIKVTSAGALQLFGVTQIGSDSAALSLDTWYRLEFRYKDSGSSDEIEGRIDGVSFASSTGALFAFGGSNELRVGLLVGAPTNSPVMYVDDVAVNQSSGSVNNSWCGEGVVCLMTPTADSQVGSWTGGAGGTSNLYAGVNNKPPTGAAAGGDADQIKSLDTSGDNSTDEYRCSLGAYSDYFHQASRINAIQIVCSSGAASGTTTTVNTAVFSNPVVAGQNMTAGGGTGAAGTWSTGWQGVLGNLAGNPTIIELPVVVMTDPVIMAVRKVDVNAPALLVCLLGLNVELTLPGDPAPAFQ